MTCHNIFLTLSVLVVIAGLTDGQLIRNRISDRINDLIGPADADNSTGVGSCPIDPNTTALDYAIIEGSCAYLGTSTEDYCNSCLCGLVALFMPAFEASGILTAVNKTGQIPLSSASNLIEECSSVLIGPMVASGTNLTGLLGLSSCNFDESTVPPCIAETFSDAIVNGTFRSSVSDNTTSNTTKGNESILDDNDLDQDIIDAVGNTSVDSNNTTVGSGSSSNDTGAAGDTNTTSGDTGTVGGNTTDTGSDGTGGSNTTDTGGDTTEGSNTTVPATDDEMDSGDNSSVPTDGSEIGDNTSAPTDGSNTGDNSSTPTDSIADTENDDDEPLVEGADGREDDEDSHSPSAKDSGEEDNQPGETVTPTPVPGGVRQAPGPSSASWMRANSAPVEMLLLLVSFVCANMLLV